MSNPFSYLKQYKELAPYLEAVDKIIKGEYVKDLETIKKNCIKEYSNNLPWGSRGIECSPDAEVFFRTTSELNTFNKNPTAHSNEAIQGSLEKKRTLEKVFA